VDEVEEGARQVRRVEAVAEEPERPQGEQREQDGPGAEHEGIRLAGLGQQQFPPASVVPRVGPAARIARAYPGGYSDDPPWMVKRQV